MGRGRKAEKEEGNERVRREGKEVKGREMRKGERPKGREGRERDSDVTI